jgi:hypothetical protein
MIPTFPVIELIDRYAIAIVKLQRTDDNHDEYMFYHEQIEKYDLRRVNDSIQELINTHHDIWNLEKELKSGKEDEVGLEELGRRAIAIRDHNNRRVALKNSIAELLGCRIREKKVEHLSE